MNMLFQIFERIAQVDPELREYLITKLVKQEVKKKFVFQKEGQVARRIYFIESGIVKCSQIWDGLETTVWFMKEGDLFVSVDSFFFQTASFDNIEALEDCTVWSISYEEVQHAYDRWVYFNRHRAVILEKYYSLSMVWGRMRHQPPYLAFQMLMEHQFDLIGRIPDRHLASYLGISPASFAHEKKKQYYKGGNS